MSRCPLLSIETWDPVEFEKAVVRRLQAALTPSLIAPPHHPADRKVVDTIASMIEDDRVQDVLRCHHHRDRVAGVILAVEEVLSRRDMLGDEETIAQLWEFIDEDDLNVMLATGRASEQPEELLSRMFEGPYRTLHS